MDEGSEVASPAMRVLLAALPSAAELEEILSEIRERMPESLPASEWPRAVAEGLRQRLELLLHDRSSAGKPRRQVAGGRTKAAPARAPTSAVEPA